VPHLLQYVTNGNYYGRIKIGGKLIRESLQTTVLFRFTKFWEKNIVIIREKWSVGIMINKEWLEPRLA
jgi:hypothetical protein